MELLNDTTAISNSSSLPLPVPPSASSSSSLLLFLLQILATLLIAYTIAVAMNLIQSPKAMLAQAIAKALAQFFVVDPVDVQTTLFGETGLSLENMQLQPMHNILVNDTTTASITGTVQRVSFQWKWGSDADRPGGSSFVKDAQLVLEGLDFTVCLTSNDVKRVTADDIADKLQTSLEVDETAMPQQQQQPKDKATGDAAPVGFIQDQVNRILEALTLTVAGMQVKIVMVGGATAAAASGHQDDETQPSLVLGAAGVKLVSMSRRTESDELVQDLSLEGLFANVMAAAAAKDNGETKQDHDAISPFFSSYPLLEPISYSTKCTRASGKRFGGDIQALLRHGLAIIGKSTDHGIVVHAGPEQLQFLNQLGDVLIAESKKDEASSVSSTAAVGGDKEENIETPANASITSSNEVADTSNGQQASFVQLPLSAVSLVLPNATKISMGGLMLDYQLDGSQFVVTGHEGISVDDFPMLGLSESGTWHADMVKSCFRVSSSGIGGAAADRNAEAIAKVHARKKELDQVKDGIQQLIGIVHDMSAQETGAMKKMSAKVAASGFSNEMETESSRFWSAEIDSMSIVIEGVDNGQSVECLIRNVKACTDDMTLTVGVVEKLRVPHTLRLCQPLTNTTLSYNGSLLDLTVEDVFAVLEEPDASQKPVDDAEAVKLVTPDAQNKVPAAINDSTILPFGVLALVKSITIYKADAKSIHTTVTALRFAAGPDADVTESGQRPSGCVRALVMMDELKHDMLSLDHAKVSAVVHPSNLNRIDKLDFDAKVIAVAAGYSVFDWKRLFATGDEKREPKKKTKAKKKGPVYLPFAHIHELKIKIAMNATVVSTKDATLHISEFQGNETTTLNDLIVWYTQRVVANAPGFVTHASLLGFNVRDTAASYGGSAVMTGTLGALGSAAAPVAGVLGMVGFDAVKSTINAGKRERGLEDDDKRQAGDFFRGIGQLAKEAAQGGAVSRGKTQDDQADALDWALGATNDIRSYTDKNKARLGGAGVGAVGFGYGFLLGGPVGAVAGALITSRATSSTINAVDRRFRGKGEELKP